MTLLKPLVAANVIPVVVGAAILIAAWLPWRHNRPVAGGRWGGAVGFGIAFLMAYLAVEGLPQLPARESWHWLFYLVLAAIGGGTADALVDLPRPARWGIWLLLAGAGGWLLPGPWVEHYWLWRLATAGAVLMLLVACDVRADGARGASLPLCFFVAAAGASVILVASYNGKLAQLAGALAATAAASVLLAWWRPAVSLTRGATAVFAVALPGLLLSGCFQASSAVPAWCFVTAALAPAAIRAGDLGPLRRGRGWKRTAVRVAAVCVPIAVAVTVSLLSAP